MQQRSVPNTIKLDQFLRSARNFYFVSSVIAVPAAALSIVWLLADISALFSGLESPGQVVWSIIIDLSVIGVAYVAMAQVFEANDRIRRLAEDPSANVKPMYVPRILKNP
jgi:hypothetical protein